MSASDTRQRALAEFGHQLLDRGYLGVSLDQIATQIGIKKPSLYHHFPGGKEEMYDEVARRYIDDVASRLRTALAVDGALVDRLEAIVKTYADGTHQASMGLRLFDATRHLSEEARTRVSRNYVDSLIAPVVELMREAVRCGDLREADPGFLASAFLEMAAVVEPMPDDVAMPPAQRDGTPADPALPRAVAELFLHGAAG